MVTAKLTKPILVDEDIRRVMKRGLDHKNFGFYYELQWRPIESLKQRSNMSSLHLKEITLAAMLIDNTIKGNKGRSRNQRNNPGER